MTALTDFVVAAGSYFGLPEGRVVEGSTVDVSNGEMELVLCIRLTSDDVVGIGKRMGVLLVQAESDARADELKAQANAAKPQPTDKQLRTEYNALSDRERSSFGSFARYKAQVLASLVEESRPATIPTHVWVPGSELTGPQLAMAMSMDERGRYAMDPADLTEKQRGEYAPGYEVKRGGQ